MPRARWSPAAYVVLLGLAVGGAGPLPALGVTCGLLAATWVWLCRIQPRVAALAVAPLVLAVGVPWPAPAIVAAALFATIGRSSVRPAIADAVRIPSRRRPRAVLETAAAAAGCVPVAAGLAHLSWGNEHPVVELARPHPAALAAGVVALALVNAAGEEWYWRGCMMRLLGDEGNGHGTTVVVQAVSFGLAHAAGLPGGPVGVVGALVLGLVLGVLRLRPAGFSGCVVVHTAVDVAIFGLVAEKVVWVG